MVDIEIRAIQKPNRRRREKAETEDSESDYIAADSTSAFLLHRILQNYCPLEYQHGLTDEEVSRTQAKVRKSKVISRALIDQFLEIR